MTCRWCQFEVPFEPTFCGVNFGRPTVTRVSPTLSTLDLSECRRCHQRKPLPFVFESPNGHVSLRFCVECAAILTDIQALEDKVNH